MMNKVAVPVPPVAQQATPMPPAAMKARAPVQAQVLAADPFEGPRPPPSGRSCSACSGVPSYRTVHSASGYRYPSS